GRPYDDSMAACVRSAVANASPSTRIIQLDQFRPVAGGALAKPAPLIGAASIADGLRSASATPAFAALNVRYLFMVEGATEMPNQKDEGGGLGGVPIFDTSHNKRTHIGVTGWDAKTGQKLASFTTDSAGFEDFVSVGLIINVLEYARTESTACKDMAG